ncbi:MAG: hypothetical protein ACI9CD_000608 [Candidatus Deianiraeaceae bacterium]|jgi:hypothetical protein
MNNTRKISIQKEERERADKEVMTIGRMFYSAGYSTIRQLHPKQYNDENLTISATKHTNIQCLLGYLTDTYPNINPDIWRERYFNGVKAHSSKWCEHKMFNDIKQLFKEFHDAYEKKHNNTLSTSRTTHGNVTFVTQEPRDTPSSSSLTGNNNPNFPCQISHFTKSIMQAMDNIDESDTPSSSSLTGNNNPNFPCQISHGKRQHDDQTNEDPSAKRSKQNIFYEAKVVLEPVLTSNKHDFVLVKGSDGNYNAYECSLNTEAPLPPNKRFLQAMEEQCNTISPSSPSL